MSLLTDWLTVAHEDVDFLGSDIRYVLMDDAETCQTTCTEDPNCQFYTYVNETFFNSDLWYSIPYAQRLVQMFKYDSRSNTSQ